LLTTVKISCRQPYSGTRRTFEIPEVSTLSKGLSDARKRKL
jgi:hypothetical protein